MSALLYFAYGSNLHPHWLRSRTPSARVVAPATLGNYQLHFNKFGLDSSGKCNIVPSENNADCVHGVVYEFDIREKAVLDVAEGGYEQHRMRIGGHKDVLIYIASEVTRAACEPFSWYRDIVIAGAELHGFPPHYLEHIRSFTAQADPDPERDRRHRAIVWPG